jgi:serine/threonine protein kinase/Tol biopolymer transport system component
LALTPGTRLGVYEVTAQIGEGGMGQVFRARDTKLDRDVAIKILPEAFAHDSDRLARFQREAKTLASLNHPNIAAIYGLEESGGMTALVMELVEGEDLSQRIARGAIPLDDALPIAKQIAEALEAAHEHGIIHRDLKPANIKVRPDGAVKVLDFGLAKALDPSPSATDVSQLPTITSPAMTRMGVIMGTAAYMSPEQARGKAVDKRADIWAFGVVLFEMLTAQRAFPGEDLTDTLAAIVKLDPKWDAVGADVPARVRQVLRVCLQKDPRQRAQAMGDVRLALEGAFETTAPQTTVATSSRPRGRLAWMVAAVAVLVAAALAIPALRYLRETPPPETRTEINTPATNRPTDFALSPDGRQIVFVASGDGASRLWLRSLATTTAQPLAGTEGASAPFWSPDNRSVGFFAGAALKRLDLGGGAPQTLAPAGNGSGGTWNADSVIVFAPGAAPLMRVSATGGAAVAVTTLGPQQPRQSSPWFLPDGRRFLFFTSGGPDTTGIYLGALDGSAPTRLTPADSAGVYLPAGPGPAEAFRGGGWLLWVRAGAVVAQRLDLDRKALTGDPVTLADGVATGGNFRSAVSVAATGLVAYRTGTGNQRQLTWVDRSGTARGTVGDPDGNNLGNPRVSPDGRRVVVNRTVQGNSDIWLLDGARTSRFTFDAAADRAPLWSPDGTRIVFRSNRTGPSDLYQKLASGAGVEERIVASDQSKVATSWSADGRFLLYFSSDQTSDLWVVPMMGDRTPSVFLKTPFSEGYGEFSPDGRWVAYNSNESGRDEIYVRPFVPPSRDASADKPGGQWQVSTAGGVIPVWRPDGKELYYLNPAGAMMAAPITVTGATLAPGAPVRLFPTRIVGGGDTGQGRQYDVAPDGRFLINTVLDSADAPITLLMNWNPEGKK